MINFILSNTIALSIIFVRGPYGVTRAQFIHNVLPAANAIMAPLELDVRRIRIIRDPKMAQGDPSWVQLQNWGQYKMLAVRNRWTRKNRVTHFILPPMLWQGGKWVGGVASNDCYRTSPAVAISNALATRTNGKSGVLFSAIALAHEVLHTAGASHQDDERWPGGVMSANALQWVDMGKTVYMSPMTLDEVSWCQYRW